MGFDPFFSSSNKDHYIKHPHYDLEVKPEVDRILALPEKERYTFFHELKVRQSRHELSYTEYQVLKKLNFLIAIKSNAKSKIRARIMRGRIKHDSVPIYRGYNST